MEMIKAFFNTHQQQFYLSIIIVGGWIVTRMFTKRAVKNLSIKFGVARERRKMIVKLTNSLFFILMLIFLITTWGVDRKELFLFFTSIITVLGIGFFAQWSILSNITSGIIIFFSHPLKLGDKIKIVDKDFNVEGKLTSITLFYMHLENQQGEISTIPNSLALQKTIVVLNES